MVLEAWIPGFIPDLVKAGQIMLALGTGLIIGNLPKTVLSKTLKLCLIIMVLGIFAALFLSLKPLVLSLFALTFLTGCLVAGAVSNKPVIYATVALCGIGLGSSVFPQSGHLPAGLFLVIVNLVGLGLVVWGAAMLSHWAFHRQTALWPKIGVRILGSWLLAISALMLALELAGMGSL